MSWRGFAVVGIVGALLGAAACSLFVDTSGLDEGSPPGSAPDGSTTVDGSPASNDGATTADSTTTTTTAPNDANVAMDARAPCEADLCDDFDVGALGAKWTRMETTRGTLTLTAPGVSAPNALRAAVTAGAGTGYAALIHTIAGIPTSTRCEWDMQFDVAPPSDEIDYVNFVTRGGDDVYSLYFQSSAGSWRISEFIKLGDGGEVAQDAFLPQFHVGQWLHFAMDVSNQTLSFSHDGVVIGSIANLHPESGSSHDIQIGLTYAATPPAASVLIDNVVCNHHL